MFRHVFMADIRDGASDGDVQELLAAWRDMGERIGEVRALTAGRNESAQDRRYAIVLVVDFADRAAWERYMQHPVHLAVRNTLSAKVLHPELRVSAQYTIQDVC